jgi:hypothetical protein
LTPLQIIGKSHLPRLPPGRAQMVTFDYMGRSIAISGSGDKENPFEITGTGKNPPLAAEIESLVVDRMFGETPWHLKNSRLEAGDQGESIAILTIRFFGPNEELLQTEIWFDVSEAFGSNSDSEDTNNGQ